MSAMDTNDGPSSSYRGGRGGRHSYNRGGQFQRSGRGGNFDSSYLPRGRAYNPGGGRGGYDDGYVQSDRGRGQSRGGYRGRGSSQSWGNRGRGYRGRGRGGAGRGVKYLEPDDIQFVIRLGGHKKQVTAVAIDPNSSQIYSGAQDGTVRVWTLDGQCTSVVNMGGEVDSLLLDSGFLFVGLHTLQQQGMIKIWNTATGAQHDLPAHRGQVLALAAANNMLFSGGQDKSIRIWKFDQPTGTFLPMVELTAAQGGHTSAVQAVVPVGQFMFSADWEGNIKVWDMQSGQCVQNIIKAHEHVIMDMQPWEGHMLTSSLDGTIKIWAACDTPAPGAVLENVAAYTHPPEDESVPKSRRVADFGGVLALAGTIDQEGRPVLLASHAEDQIVRLWELPSFAERGHLPDVRDARALAVGCGLLVTGDKGGSVKVWRWKPAPMPLT